MRPLLYDEQCHFTEPSTLENREGRVWPIIRRGVQIRLITRGISVTTTPI